MLASAASGELKSPPLHLGGANPSINTGLVQLLSSACREEGLEGVCSLLLKFDGNLNQSELPTSIKIVQSCQLLAQGFERNRPVPAPLSS